jgi:D-amino-acid dehydrogenase
MLTVADMNAESPVIVIGAGIVGTATARALQRAGHAVTLVDSAEPGKATSYGNAGFIAIDHVLPLARPSTLKRVPQMLMDRNGPLTVHPPSIPYLLPWMARFALAAYSTPRSKRASIRSAADGRGQHRLEGRDPGLGPGRAVQEPGRALRLRERGSRSPRAPRSASCRRPRAPSSRSSTATARASWRPACRAISCAASTIPHGMHTINPYKGGDDLSPSASRPTAAPRAAGRVRGFGATATASPRCRLTDAELPAKAGGDRGRPRLGRADRDCSASTRRWWPSAAIT